jgi:hypothetical protein
MPGVALPLRISRDGQFERGDATDQVIRLIQAMAGTTASSWPHAPWFGLHELFLDANLALQEQQTLADAINTALRNLGADWVQVTAVRTPRSRTPGERRFEITLIVDGAHAVHGAVNV